MRKISLYIGLLLLTFSLQAQIKWQQVQPGVWKGIVGEPEAYSLFQVAGARPCTEALQKMGNPLLPVWMEEANAEVYAGKTSLRFPLQKGEQLYGFGLNFQTVRQRGKILTLRVDHYGGKDNGRTHAPVPFYLSDLGYGILINSARYLTVYAGTAARKDSENAPEPRDRNTDKEWSSRPYSDAVEILVPAAGVEVYLFAGPTTLDVVRRYNLFCGGGVLPPRWGLGFTQRVHKMYTAEQVKNEAAEFEKRQYPLDFIGLEPGWQTKAYPCTFEWDASRFPDPAGFIRDMADRGVKVNLWTNPYVSPDSPIYKDIAPYSGSHTVWCGIVPDFATVQARRILSSYFEKEHIDIGVSGYKIDEVDGYDYYMWPDVAQFPSGLEAEQLRQTYGLWVQRITDSLYREKNRRTYGLVRASNAGAASFPYVIYNDYYSHPDFITALINSSFCGVLWTPEVRGSQTAEEWLRRFQSVVFSPMAMINAWASGTKPWSFPEVAEQVKEYAQLRMRMMPYWYSEFAAYHFEGTPPFRAMQLEPGFKPGSGSLTGSGNLEDNPYLEAVSGEVKDQYMAGQNLLVAPVFAGQKTRTVVLPVGKWYDFYTGEYAGNGETISVTPGLDRIPVFVRDGGIVPMMELRMHAPANGEKVNIEIRHYGEKPGTYHLYDDDGETFDYEKGLYSWREIRVEKQKNGNWKGSISKASKGMPDHIAGVSWRYMTPGK